MGHKRLNGREIWIANVSRQNFATGKIDNYSLTATSRAGLSEAIGCSVGMIKDGRSFYKDESTDVKLCIDIVSSNLIAKQR